MDIETARFNMIEQQIRPWEVLDADVLRTCAEVRREHFVPEQFRSLAFTDTEIELGHGQRMMPPKVEARALQSLQVTASDRILEIGTGSGYMTALLGSLGAHVTTIEIHESLSEAAEANLKKSGLSNIKLHIGDGLDGWKTAEPYDVIMVTGSCPERRAAIEAQLSINGRLFIVIGTGAVMEAILVTRAAKDVWIEESLFETRVDPLIGAEDKPRFEF